VALRDLSFEELDALWDAAKAELAAASAVAAKSAPDAASAVAAKSAPAGQNGSEEVL
jgi:hypothetical protein